MNLNESEWPAAEQRAGHSALAQPQNQERHDWRNIKHSYRRNGSPQRTKQRFGRPNQKTHEPICITGANPGENNPHENRQGIQTKKTVQEITNDRDGRANPATRGRENDASDSVQNTFRDQQNEITKDNDKNYRDKGRHLWIQSESHQHCPDRDDHRIGDAANRARGPFEWVHIQIIEQTAQQNQPDPGDYNCGHAPSNEKN